MRPPPLGMFAVPAPAVVSALADAARAGAQAAIIIGSGFEDRNSPERRALDEFAAASPMRIIGPNCVGTLGTDVVAGLQRDGIRPGDPVGLAVALLQVGADHAAHDRARFDRLYAQDGC